MAELIEISSWFGAAAQQALRSQVINYSMHETALLRGDEAPFEEKKALLELRAGLKPDVDRPGNLIVELPENLIVEFDVKRNGFYLVQLLRCVRTLAFERQRPIVAAIPVALFEHGPSICHRVTIKGYETDRKIVALCNDYRKIKYSISARFYDSAETLSPEELRQQMRRQNANSSAYANH